MSDNRDHRESMEERLERIGACGMGYPSLGLPCVRPKDHLENIPKFHSSPVSDCFALVKKDDGTVWGVYMQQDDKAWTDDQTQWPTDIRISTPLFQQKLEEPVPDRRAAIAHTRAMS